MLFILLLIILGLVALTSIAGRLHAAAFVLVLRRRRLARLAAS
ncbi:MULTISPECIES: hypothetical protein [Paenarthrobacter]|nr:MULTISPECIES: hypothetical protein [Paenarthrobacter]MDD7833829.1 hypothetical protein [Paenarthrobacter sp. AB444]MDP9933870.1 hypothetical protein [Paenarthrobacter nicotinovorans]